MNLPNKLTLSRIVLTGFFMMFMLMDVFWARYAAVIIFGLAALTDMLDGQIARKYNLITPFGQYMDPIADKLLVVAAFCAFVELRLIPAWMIVILISREFLITGLRFYALSIGKQVPVSRAGKHKTISQFVTIIGILLFLTVRDTLIVNGFVWTYSMAYISRVIIWIAILITVGLTLASGIIYLWRYREVFE